MAQIGQTIIARSWSVLDKIQQFNTGSLPLPLQWWQRGFGKFYSLLKTPIYLPIIIPILDKYSSLASAFLNQFYFNHKLAAGEKNKLFMTFNLTFNLLVLIAKTSELTKQKVQHFLLRNQNNCTQNLCRQDISHLHCIKIYSSQ